MIVEMILAEYHQPLDAVLTWSTGRLSVIWSKRVKRAKAMQEAIEAARRDAPKPDRAPRDRGHLPRSNRGHVEEVECNNLAELARGLNLKPEPYPGRTPFQPKPENIE